MIYNRELLQVLCPFGIWNHPRGKQLIDEKSAQKMKNAEMFLFRKIPIFVGHPDENINVKAIVVGWIKEICITKGGIAILAAYSQKAYDDILSGKLRAMSPRWKMERISGGVFRPVDLLSIGLTNEPNIPSSGKIIEII